MQGMAGMGALLVPRGGGSSFLQRLPKDNTTLLLDLSQASRGGLVSYGPWGHKELDMTETT